MYREGVFCFADFPRPMMKGVFVLAEEIKLTGRHLKVWNILRSLKDGERIRGVDLRSRANIQERHFYLIIEDLQAAGCFIGASRNENKGYYQIRTYADMTQYLTRKRNELRREADALDEFESKWLNHNVPIEEVEEIEISYRTE